ncbi:MAG TPA: tetratricopeptide repeat protein [Terracidiphilus sp.]
MNSRSVSALFFLLVVGCVLCRLNAAAQSGGEYDRALAEFRAGDYSSAAARFASIDAGSPGATDALVYRSKCLVHLQDFSGAEKALRRYLESHRNSSDALYMLGFVLNRENRPADSLAAYTQAAAITPPTSDDLKIVGLDYVLLNDNSDAIKWLEKAVAFDSKNKDAWYYLGRAYYTQPQLFKAKQAFLTALQLDPRDAKAENGLGLVFESDAQPAAALDAFQKAIAWDESNPRKSEEPYVNLGSLLLEQGRIQDAIKPLETAVVLAPGNAYCHMRLGTMYFRAGKMEQAQQQLEKATQLDPENAPAHYQLGRIYKVTHQPDRATAEFDRTAELQSRSVAPTVPPLEH